MQSIMTTTTDILTNADTLKTLIKDATQDIILVVSIWSLITINSIKFSNSKVCELLFLSVGVGFTFGYIYKHR